jgi:hypothetical protein
MPNFSKSFYGRFFNTISVSFDSASGICCDGKVLKKKHPGEACCGKGLYDPVAYSTSCCNGRVYNSLMMGCCDGQTYNKAYKKFLG